MQDTYALAWHSKSSATHQVSFFNFIKILTTGIFLWQNNLYWLFQTSHLARLYLEVLVTIGR